MREFIDITKIMLNEADIVDFAQHKTNKMLAPALSGLQDIIDAEADFFSTGKFAPFAKTYIESGFKPELAPKIEVDVKLRDDRPGPEAKAVILKLRAERFKITGATQFAKGSRPAFDPNGDAHGPFGVKVISMEQARALFAEREQSPYGAYQESRSGFRTATVNKWDERGVGFSIMVGGHDNRRGGKYGNATREEWHIIDNEADMKEVAHMFALIQRARMTIAN